MCLDLLKDAKFFSMLIPIDEDIAQQTRDAGCPCGGSLHQSTFPRKPRGCPKQFRWIFSVRFSFCCNVCRTRSTPKSVRFHGRCLFPSVVFLLVSDQSTQAYSITTRLSQSLGVSLQTLHRWRAWWQKQFPLTALWQAMCAQFMPPVPTQQLPSALMQRLGGVTAEVMTRLLLFLSPLSVSNLFTLREGC